MLPPALNWEGDFSKTDKVLNVYRARAKVQN